MLKANEGRMDLTIQFFFETTEGQKQGIAFLNGIDTALGFKDMYGHT